MVPIEQALASLGSAPEEKPKPVPPPPIQVSGPAPPRGPSPFELDRAKKAAVHAEMAAPASDAEWKQRLHAELMEIGMKFTADGVEHSTIVASAGELQFTTPEEFMLAMKPEDLGKAVSRIVGRPMRIKITPGRGTAPVKQERAPEDETSSRALANPEVKRFQEVFGGQVRTVRNLKE